jgi:hypothetical protein
VWTWGCNDVGELGDGTNTERHAPVQVVGLSNVIAITARDYHNLALTADGTLWAWGSNNHGQLGDGTTTDRNAPVLVAPVGSLGLAPTNLPDAVVGTAYDQTLQTTGGTPPYTFSVHSGALPTGLALAPTGAVSGVPTAAGDFAFSVDATDANGCTATASYTLGVATTAAPVACAGALFCDDFADGVLARDWTYTTPSWNEAGGELVGTVKRRTSQAVASPAFAGCSLCTFATSMASDRGCLAFEPWYRDPRNTVVVLMSRRGRRFVMRQVQNGATVARVRLKADRHGPGQPHDVSVTFDGTMLTLTVDDKPPVGMRAVGVVQGTASFLAKRTTGRFGFILVR